MAYVKARPAGRPEGAPRAIADVVGPPTRELWEDLKFLLPTEGEIERRRHESQLLALDSLLSSIGADPVAILAKAVEQHSKKRPQGRPRKAVPTSDEMNELLDETTRDAWDAWDLAAQLGAAPRFRQLNRTGQFTIRLFFVLGFLQSVKRKEIPADLPYVRAMIRWLALEREKADRARRGARMPTRGDEISVPFEESLVSAGTIEKGIERNAPWLRDK